MSKIMENTQYYAGVKYSYCITYKLCELQNG